MHAGGSGHAGSESPAGSAGPTGSNGGSGGNGGSGSSGSNGSHSHHSSAAPTGQLADNVMHFARVLRAAGMAVGTDRVQLALQALPLAGLERREDFHEVLQACLLDRHEHQALFDQAFAIFWRDGGPNGLADMTQRAEPASAQPKVPESRRLAEALFPQAKAQPTPAPAERETARQAELSWSQKERLRRADFESMSSTEWREAQRALAQLRRAITPEPTRRLQPAPHARPGRTPDWRATLRTMGRQGGAWAGLSWRAPRRVAPPLVVLADISGSMASYSRMLLHFAHLLGHMPGAAPPRVESFVFGTRLTRITRWLRQRDPDVAVALVSNAVQDWGGGTRIAECLHEFNRRWARRVLAGNATVLLVSDGLEMGEAGTLQQLAFEMERLKKSCRRLLWLNPLLRYEQFEPRAGGMRAMRPHVDALLPVHNLASLEQLVQVLARPVPAQFATRAATASALCAPTPGPG